MNDFGKEAVSALVDRWLQESVPSEVRSKLTADMLYPLVDSIESFTGNAMNWAASIECESHAYM